MTFGGEIDQHACRLILQLIPLMMVFRFLLDAYLILGIISFKTKSQFWSGIYKDRNIQ
jgi:hypothetical protein